MKRRLSWGDREDNVLCARRVKAIKDMAYSEWKVNGDFEKFEEKNFYFKIAVAVEVLENLMGYRVD